MMCPHWPFAIRCAFHKRSQFIFLFPYLFIYLFFWEEKKSHFSSFGRRPVDGLSDLEIFLVPFRVNANSEVGLIYRRMEERFFEEEGNTFGVSASTLMSVFPSCGDW